MWSSLDQTISVPRERRKAVNSMDDLISRREAITELDKMPTFKDGNNIEYIEKSCTKIKINALPTAQQKYDEWCYSCAEYNTERHSCPRWNRVIRQTVDDLKAAQPGWISCSERLPDNNRQVLVYARSVHFALAKYDEMREADGTYKMQWVTFDAWKPFYKIKFYALLES